MADSTRSDDLIAHVKTIWDTARAAAVRSVNSAHDCANWLTGPQIVESEQRGENRASYGGAIIPTLSQSLTHEFGRGFSVSALKYMRVFYTAYPHLLPIGHALSGRLGPAGSLEKGHALRDLFKASQFRLGRMDARHPQSGPVLGPLSGPLEN